MKFKRQIPNILSALRLITIPFVAWTFLCGNRMIAFILFAAANATDVLDGIIARKFGYITEVGKILDPLADKLLQITTAVCLAISNGVYIILAALLICKELTMLIGGLIVLRKQKVHVVSAWYGKLATVCYFAIVCVFILLPDIAPFDLILTLLLCAIVLTALLMYYFKMFKGQYGINVFNTKEANQ